MLICACLTAHISEMGSSEYEQYISLPVSPVIFYLLLDSNACASSVYATNTRVGEREDQRKLPIPRYLHQCSTVLLSYGGSVLQEGRLPRHAKHSGTLLTVLFTDHCHCLQPPIRVRRINLPLCCSSMCGAGNVLDYPQTPCVRWRTFTNAWRC